MTPGNKTGVQSLPQTLSLPVPAPAVRFPNQGDQLVIEWLTVEAKSFPDLPHLQGQTPQVPVLESRADEPLDIFSTSLLEVHQRASGHSYIGSESRMHPLGTLSAAQCRRYSVPLWRPQNSSHLASQAIYAARCSAL
jgi:hypothetical protein